jgi:hypothetical protein
MALNSNFVINRIGFTPGESGSRSPDAPRDLDATYTSSRLGLSFVRQDQPFVEPAETFTPAPLALDDEDTAESRLGISPEIEYSEPPKPFWPRFRNAATMLAGAVSKGILRKLEPRQRAPKQIEASQDFVSHPVQCPSPKSADDADPIPIYRKGTYKIPTELMARLKNCATVSHEYQYSLVTESLDDFLTTKGFPHDVEVDDN